VPFAKDSKVRVGQPVERVADLRRPDMPRHLFILLAYSIGSARLDCGHDPLDRYRFDLIRYPLERSDWVGMQLFVTYGDRPPAVQPAIRLGNLLTKLVGKEAEHVFVVERFPIHHMTGSRSIPAQAPRGSFLLPVVHRDEDIIRVSSNGDVMGGDGVDYIAETMVNSRVMVEHAAVGERSGSGKFSERFRACGRGVPPWCWPLQPVDRREQAADPMVS
jgi:hypothetical protein